MKICLESESTFENFCYGRRTFKRNPTVAQNREIDSHLLRRKLANQNPPLNLLNHLSQRAACRKRARGRRTKGLTPGLASPYIVYESTLSRRVIASCNTSYSSLSCGAAWGPVDNPLWSQQVTVYDFCDRSSHENSVKGTDVLCGTTRDDVRSLEVCITSLCHERSLGMEKICMIVLSEGAVWGSGRLRGTTVRECVWHPEATKWRLYLGLWGDSGVSLSVSIKSVFENCVDSEVCSFCMV